MSLTDPTADPATEPLPVPRTRYGTAWRCAVTLFFALVSLGAAAWLDAQFHIDGATASLPTSVVSLVIGGLTVGWLRVSQIWILFLLLSADVAGLSASVLLSRGVLDGGRLNRAELTDGTLSEVLAGLAALGVVVLVVSIVWAAARGHRHPAVHSAAKDA
ncbi:hypothetical protein AB0M87_06685 [Streptomyces sp. NPDC051320]|uniref:hypothetical protein n=1 Tax=Streptomyces sp. NPDC051320 TaxID=3154644 RepID=UPI003418A25D